MISSMSFEGLHLLGDRLILHVCPRVRGIFTQAAVMIPFAICLRTLFLDHVAIELQSTPNLDIVSVIRV